MHTNLKNESGMTMVEAMIAILVLLVGLLGLAQVLAFSVITSKTYGRDAGKATAAAQEKMEELITLQFNDTTSNVTVSPATATGGTGLTAGGSIYPSAPTAGYADYLNVAGSRTTSGNSAYTRQWQVTNTSANLKTITVSVTSTRSLGTGAAPSTVLITQKAPERP
jgi:Tfp pilus assembly protein PilV